MRDGPSLLQERLIVFRTDASTEIGGGHVRRCIVLADRFVEAGWRVAFATREGTTRAVPLLARRGYDVREFEPVADEPAALRRMFRSGCDLLVADHYGRDHIFESACIGWARYIAVIDDQVTRRHTCDALIDQTPGRQPADYAGLVPDRCQLLVGPTYALLDPAFAAIRAAQRRKARGNRGRILVNFGHIGHVGLTMKVLEALEGRGAAVDIVFGLVPADIDVVRKAAERLRPPAVIHIDLPQMADVMAAADLAVGAGGVTALERCCLGLPSLLVVLADNQRDNAEALAAMGAARVIGTTEGITVENLRRELSALLDDPEAMLAMRTAAETVTDGLGATHVLNVLCDLPANKT